MLLAIAFALLGAVIASFVGVMVERVHTGQSWIRSRSRCNSCDRELEARDLVPVLSWIASRGRCFSCGARIPGLYALSEAALGFLFALAYLTFGLTVSFALFLIALSVLAFIVLYDLRHTIVLPQASALLITSALAFDAVTTESAGAFGLSLLVAGVIALGFFLLFFFSGGRVMGLGDSPAAFALSLLAGPLALPGLLFSFWIGAVIGIGILVSRPAGHRMGIEVPFVPFLAAGYLLAIFTQWNPFFFIS